MTKCILLISLVCAGLHLATCEDSKNDGWFNASPQEQETGDLLAMESQQYETKEEYVPSEDNYGSDRRRRRKYRNRPVLRYGQAYPSYDYKYDNEYIDRIDRDGVPASSGYSGPSSYDVPPLAYEQQSSGYDVPAGYEAPSGYEALGYVDNSIDGTIPSATYDSTPSYSGNSKKKSTFSGFLNALAAFLPIGLFLAAIPPNLIVINSDTSKRKRSADEENSVENSQLNIMDRIEMGFARLQDTSCQKFLACENALYGKHQVDANRLQRALSSLAYYTPPFLAEYFNTLDVFKAVQNDDCSTFSCHQF